MTGPVPSGRMAQKALFVGVDRYADASIPDLSGAKRDALALATLFEDTVHGMAVRALIDAEATHAAVEAALSDLLGGAGSDDTVVVFFAGHGSRDHHLILHDTERANLAGTALPMANVADLFRRCRARATLCLLDCCFSGAAPARVLEDTPASRDIASPFEALAGKGRVLVAAADHTQPAWEHPRTRHGLFTQALLDALQALTEPADIARVMADVMRRVQADASALGKTQTPVSLGLIEGELKLPPLVPGARFYAAFPDRRPAAVATIRDLETAGVPRKAVDLWEGRFPAGLNELQRAAIARGVLNGTSLLVVAPTGAGKTFVGELAAMRAVAEGRRTAFLLPYRALVNEKFEDFARDYGDALGLRVVRCTGDHQDQRSAFANGKYDLALLTYEMFLTLALGSPAVIERLGLVVLDEAQFITDPRRGITVELLLTLLRVARERSAEPQVVALSAVIGATNGFEDWLVAQLLTSDRRPVPLVEGVLDRSGSFRHVGVDGKEAREQLVPAGEIHIRRDGASAQDVIVPLVRKLMRDPNETVIVFRNQRGPTEGCAAYLAAELSLPPTTTALAALPRHDHSTTSSKLRACLARGTAFHNSNLARDERVTVERTFRAGDLRVLAATTTLAAGINTPASTVILAEQEFLGEDGRPFTIAEYKNMAGRAGRPGFGRPGRAILLAETPFEADRLFERYVLGRPEPIRSSFDAKDLETWVLRLLVQARRLPRADVARLLSNTFGGYEAARRDPNWLGTVSPRIDAIVGKMLDLDLLEAEDDQVRLTLLGRACGRSSLAFRSCLRLIELLRGLRGPALSAETLMVLLQMMPEADQAYTPFAKNLREEKARPQQLAQRVGSDVVRALQRHAEEEADWPRRCKRALVLFDWIVGFPMEEIERRNSPPGRYGQIGRGDIERFADATRFHLRAAAEIARVMLTDSAPTEEQSDALLRRLEFGVLPTTLGLLTLQANWTRGELLALQAIGVDTADALWARSKGDLRAVLGDARVEALQRLRPVDLAPTV